MAEVRAGDSGSLAGEVYAILAEEVDERRTCRAAQATVIRDGEVLADVACGRAHDERPFTTHHLWAAYCCGKVAIAAAVLALVDRGELDLESPVGRVLPEARGRWFSVRPLWALLDGTAGLHEPSWMLARVLPERARTTWVLATPPPSPWSPGTSVGYAAYAPWHLLGMVIEAVAHAPYEEVVDNLVLGPWHIPPTAFVGRLNPSRYDDLAGRVSVAWSGQDPDLPLLAEAGHETAAEWNPAFGAYATTGGLAGILAGVLADARGAGRALAPGTARLLLDPHAAGHDVVLDRTVSYSHGLLAELGNTGFAELPEDAAGVTAEGGVACCFVSAALGVSIALRFDRMVSVGVGSDERRVRVLAGIFGHLGFRVD